MHPLLAGCHGTAAADSAAARRAPCQHRTPMPKARLASSRRTALATRAALLTRIAVLKATRPPGWQTRAKALCNRLADLAGLDGARPEADQHDQEVAT